MNLFFSEEEVEYLFQIMNQNPTQENKRNIPAIIFTKAFTGDPFFSWAFPENIRKLFINGGISLRRNAKINPQWILTSDPTESTSSIWTKPVEGSIESDPDDAQTAFINLVQGLVGDRLPKVLEVFAEVDASHPKRAALVSASCRNGATDARKRNSSENT